MQGSALQNDMKKIISLVDLLRDIGLDQQLSLPKVVVLGTQSSGKSSLLEQIVGLDFLPRGRGVTTRRPLQLRMNNDLTLKTPYAQFDEVVQAGKKKKFTNFNEVRRTIEQVTNTVCGIDQNIVDYPIILNIFSPHCPNLTIVDLPGLTSIRIGDQPQNIHEVTKDLALRYIKDPRSIILCVIPANQDLSTSQALSIMTQIDPLGQRSIGCLTKIDIMNRGDDAREILKNKEIPLKYGYVGIKNRCQQDVINNVPVQQSLKQQKIFFTTSPIYSTLPPGTFGTESLTQKLTGILYQQIKSSLPTIFEEIKKKKKDIQSQLQKLGPGVANTDTQMASYAWKSASSFLRIYTNSINGIKSPEYNNDSINPILRQQLNNLYNEQYEEPATAELNDADIERALLNFSGTIPGFLSVDSFLALLSPLLKQLQSPAFQINNKIHEIIEHEAIEIIDKIMLGKFPNFNIKFVELVKNIFEKHRRNLESFLRNLLDAEINYLYTNDVSFLMSNSTEKEQNKLYPKNVKSIEVYQLRKRIDSYYKLVVRNLRNLIPKQIFNFLIVKCSKQLEFEIFQFTNDTNQLKVLLTQPAEIKDKRISYIKAIKILEESEKRIKLDPQISKLLNDSKYKNNKKIIKKAPQIDNARRQKQNYSNIPARIDPLTLLNVSHPSNEVPARNVLPLRSIPTQSQQSRQPSRINPLDPTVPRRTFNIANFEELWNDNKEIKDKEEKKEIIKDQEPQASTYNRKEALKRIFGNYP